ncbi:MAG: PfkB family carbohydrate kinase [Marivita sp.]|uniref:PfkB family carbohydrate kinase n=1 Tax=Marivita sp. TaxID=2003365 RepID=UPI0025C5CAAF|nr:PfkB family carbohydrate kinase [Marivita sp.]MCI5109766.1 PfkB family carbohydrate kinase [Marivita sp.]
MPIFNLGSINLDRFYNLSRLPREGDTMSAHARSVDLGGKGFNISVAITRAGGIVTHIGAIGASDTGTLHRIAEQGVSCNCILKHGSAPTGEAIIYVASDGGNCIVLEPGANRKMASSHIRSCLDEATAGDWLILQNETNGHETAIDTARAKGMKIALVAAPFDANALIPLIDKVDLVSANEVEYAQIAPFITADPARYADTHFAITFGADRAEYRADGKVWQVPSMRVSATNTTGAGDTFFGYLMVGLDSGMTYPEALNLANAAAALKVQREGSASGIPYRPEVDDLLQDSRTDE